MAHDIIIICSGPGGYVAAIRASQLGMKVGVVEKAELGGICLNWGCIPAKSLLKSAQVYEYARHASDFGILISGEIKPDFKKIIERSRNVAAGMSNGIQFLFRKNKIEYLKGHGRLIDNKTVEVSDDSGRITKATANHIIIATGARSRELPTLKIDGKKIIGYREALVLPELPKTMLVVGSGAIGSEFAWFYSAMGTKVTLIEMLPEIVPLEDVEISKQLTRSFKKSGITIFTGSTVESVDISGNSCRVAVKTPKGTEEHNAEIVLLSVGISPNIENIGIEALNIELENDKIKTDDFYRTNVEGIYAIGDIVKGQALAHVASAEGIICVEKIAGLNPNPLDYGNIPSCIYTSPEVASVGMTEKAAVEAGYEIKVGKFPYSASGKASAAGSKEGFVKLIFDAKYGELLGAHLIGLNVTEMIAELVVARKLETTGHELIKAVHPHPTMSEAVMEAAAAAYGEVVHL